MNLRKPVNAPLAPHKNSTVPRHMSTHSPAAARIVQAKMIPKRATVAAAAPKSPRTAPAVYQPQPVRTAPLRKTRAPGPGNRTAQVRPTAFVVQRALNNQALLPDVLRHVLDSESARQELSLSDLGRLRRVSKNTKTQVDQNAATPGAWAVLHRLRDRSFDRFLSNMLPNEDPFDRVDQQKLFEETSSKYDPSKYGDVHSWEGNEKWLDEINHRFSRIAVLALPLSKSNLERQTGSQQDQFSAYARELAYVFLNNFRSSARQNSLTYGRMPNHSLEKVEAPQQLSERQKFVLESVLANKRQAVSVRDALITFSELGVPVSAEELQQARN